VFPIKKRKVGENGLKHVENEMPRSPANHAVAARVRVKKEKGFQMYHQRGGVGEQDLLFRGEKRTGRLLGRA